ncbi:MAG: 23S rRNA (pseudouridine(1915)-N(3))-methyltransferase RlmH [Candidatus Zixiibacteriota bacterium]
MVRIRVVGIGKDKDQWVSDAIEHFGKLLSRWASLDWQMLAGPAGTRSAPEIRRQEATLILSKCHPRATVIALTDQGEQMDSLHLARRIESLLAHGSGKLLFVIGGAYGLDRSVLDRADVRLSLSPLTFSHQLVRPILAEQLYRAFSILHGTDYHK